MIGALSEVDRQEFEGFVLKSAKDTTESKMVKELKANQEILKKQKKTA